MRGFTRATVTSVVLAVALTPLGCRSATEVSDGTLPADSAAAEISSMDLEMRREELPSSFPIEIPVAHGRVVRADEVEGESSVWSYELVADASVPDVAEWYRMAYDSARWMLIEEETVVGTDGGAALLLVFVKGSGAETILHIAEAEDGGSSVRASVALGVLVQPG